MAFGIGSIPSLSPAEFLAEEAALVEELSNQALDKGVNHAQLIAQTYADIEKAAQAKTHLKADVLEGYQKKLETVTHFLGEIEAQLADENIKDISLTTTQANLDLLQEMRRIMGSHPLLDKDTWSRKEAQALQQGLTRHSQIILQQASLASTELNRVVEEGMELHQIARKCLEMLDRHMQTLTSNQRGR